MILKFSKSQVITKKKKGKKCLKYNNFFSIWTNNGIGNQFMHLYIYGINKLSDGKKKKTDFECKVEN